MSGQQRVVAGLGKAMVTGWDIGAGLDLARALGVNLLFAAEMLPVFEGIAIRQINQQNEAQFDD